MTRRHSVPTESRDLRRAATILEHDVQIVHARLGSIVMLFHGNPKFCGDEVTGPLLVWSQASHENLQGMRAVWLAAMHD